MTQETITISKEKYDILQKCFDSVQNKDNAIFTYGTEKSFIIITCKTSKQAKEQFQKDMNEIKSMLEQRDEALRQFGQANKNLSEELTKLKSRNLWQRIWNR